MGGNLACRELLGDRKKMRPEKAGLKVREVPFIEQLRAYNPSLKEWQKERRAEFIPIYQKDGLSNHYAKTEEGHEK